VIFQLLGGIGLFLLGMVLLTDGLKAFAGDSLRQALLLFTGKPVTAFVSGFTVTSLVQSSSATTLATIGFVSAGLLTFPQAIGIVIGASLGTTSTGWIVSTIGLKFSIGAFALPLTGVGAFMRLMARGRWASLGLALAGFGLIFIGIDTLQAGMAGLAETIDLGAAAFQGFWGHFVLLFLGLVMTVVMQSSSAAMATTLAALHSGAIAFDQAASLAVGSAIGTTVTAAIAAIGATTPAKRTALAHITFNAATGFIAILLLPLFLMFFAWMEARTGEPSGAVSLALFHSSFILLGVLLFLPFTRPFARLIERMLPERGTLLTRHLDVSLYTVPSVAVEAGRNSLRAIAVEEMTAIETGLTGSGAVVGRGREERRQALEQARLFIAGIPLEAGNESIGEARICLFHALDHLTQWMEMRPREAAPEVRSAPELEKALALATEALQLAKTELGEQAESDNGALERLEVLAKEAAAYRREVRPRLLEAVSLGKRASTPTLRLLDHVRWLDGCVYHLSRASHYLRRGD
jgi:phosphate:Na+ symporter